MISLSEREEQVVTLLSRGLSMNEIGQELKIESSTVHTYVKRVAERLPGSDPPLRKVLKWSLRRRKEGAAT